MADLDSAPSYFAIEARCAMPHNKVSRRALCYWRIVWNYVDSDNYSFAEFAVDSRRHIDGIDTPAANISLGNRIAGEDTITAGTTLKSGQNFDIGFNSMAVEWSAGEAKVYAGTNRLKFATQASFTSPSSPGCGIITTDSLIVSELIVESEIPASRPLHTGWTTDSLRSYIAASTDSIEGFWHHLDRENDPAKARMGGTYTLATIKNTESGTYDIIYIDGASVNPHEWQPGMRKGTLTPTIFRDHFDLTWYDALCMPVLRDCHAGISQNAILELNFPLMDTKIRLSRVPTAKH